MVKINYNGSDYKKVEKQILAAFRYVSNFFKIKTGGIIINVFDSRANFNKSLGEKTADWMVGNCNKNIINIFSPAAMGKQGNHKSSEFSTILTHELAHNFLDKLAKGKTIPIWLNEGLAAHIAKQHRDSRKLYFIEESFCEKLGTCKGWDEHVAYGAYKIAAKFVDFLIKKYSFEKIKRLLKSLDEVYYYKNFRQLFFNVYGKTINETEIEFVKFINKDARL